MGFRRLCKAEDSTDIDKCPAVYLSEDLLTMIAQGKVLDAATLSNLLSVADDETAVRIATETVLRAVGKLLAERGRADLATEIETVLTGIELAAVHG